MDQGNSLLLWQNVFVKVGLEVAKTFGGPLGEIAARLILSELLDIKSAEITLLGSIGQNVTALLHGPYNAGMIHLADANKPYRHSTDQYNLIESARLAFVEAHGQEQEAKDMFRLAIIEYHIALCWLLRGYTDDAREWFLQSHSTALKCLVKWHDDANNGVDNARTTSQIAIGTPLIFIPFTPFLYLSKQVRKFMGDVGQSVYLQINEQKIVSQGEVIFHYLLSIKLLAKQPAINITFPDIPQEIFDGFFNARRYQ